MSGRMYATRQKDRKKTKCQAFCLNFWGKKGGQKHSKHWTRSVRYHAKGENHDIYFPSQRIEFNRKCGKCNYPREVLEPLNNTSHGILNLLFSFSFRKREKGGLSVPLGLNPDWKLQLQKYQPRLNP